MPQLHQVAWPGKVGPWEPLPFHGGLLLQSDNPAIYVHVLLGKQSGFGAPCTMTHEQKSLF